jgi:hypothetical protein
MNITQFQFTKLWYTTTQLLEIIPISRATFYRIHKELIDEGRDLAEMGKIKIKGMENTLWCPVTFVKFLLNHKLVSNPISYNYGKVSDDDNQLQSENIKVAIGFFNKKQKQTIQEIN